MEEIEKDDDIQYEPEQKSQLQMLWDWMAFQRGDKDELDLNPENDADYVFGIALALNEQEKAELEDLDRAREEAERDMDTEQDFC